MNGSLFKPPLLRRLPRMLALAALALPGARAPAEPSQCSLGIPGAPVVRVTANAAENAWLAANYAYPAMALGAAPTNAVSVLDPEMIGDDLVRLAAVEAGFAVERIKPQYWLADRITPPDDVDWDATYTLFLEENANPERFFFDTATPALYAAAGGTAPFTWVLTDGQRQEHTYILGTASQTRPRRIFWTDWPYQAPPVDLTGKFVKFFGDPLVLTPQFGVATNIVGGISQVLTNKITRGLYLDQTTKQLFAAGEISGQVLMVYYDSGTFETPLLVQAVEVARPRVVPMKGVIGEPLRPNGSGYNCDGLRARPTVVQETDNRGPYLYRHMGNNSYSPKHGNVYPLRPTVGARWNAEVYWMEADELQVEWPFELCQYECDWPADVPVFVRGTLAGADGATDYGRPIFIPDDYTATLMDYQEPEGHARAVEADGTFVTRGEGWSLLRLVGDDNIWFLPIHSVRRDDPTRFTLAPSDLEVGLEAALRGGSVAGIAPGWDASPADPSLPGYLYRAASGTAYNPTLYRDPASEQGSAVPSGYDEAGSPSNALPSAVFLVTVDGKPLEVWWSAPFQTDDMPSAVAIPSLPQVYNPVWPSASQTPQIVIASQQGSANQAIYEQGGALVFDSTVSSMELPKRAYFTQAGGAIHFWTRACDSAAGPGQLLNLQGGGDRPFSLSIAATVAPGPPATETYRLAFSGWKDPDTPTNVVVDVARALGDPFQWVSVGLARTGAAFRLYFDGELAYACDLPAFSSFAFESCLDSGFLGAAQGAEAMPNREIAEISFWNQPFDAAAFHTLAYRRFSATDPGLTGYFAFEDGRDLKVAAGSNLRTAYERLYNHPCVCRDVLLRTPGAPALGAGVIDADNTPSVYAQPDRAAVGYNPNEEHAFVRAGSGGHVAWALRCDLNTEQSSRPGVLVQYEKDGRARMQYFAVVLTNSVYPELAADCVAGQQLPGPHPLDYLDDPWLEDTYWDPPPEGQTEPCGFRDRKRQVWARCAGILPIHMYYPMQEGFWFPSLPADRQPEVGAPIPWLSLLDGDKNSPNPNAGPPACWTWRVTWPEAVPEMAIGQTLTLPTGGLPEVWNAKSMAVVYPEPNTSARTVLLYDPTVAQTVAFDPNHLAALGLKTGSNEKLLSRKGKYWFQDISPAISSRVYVDPAAKALVCIGVKEENPGGVELLHVNVLSDAERGTLLDLVDPSLRSGAAWAAWSAAVDLLATRPVAPTRPAIVNNTDLQISYIPADHYALTAMGATNYVVLIENDATNRATGVSPADPISMQVLRVAPRYHTGRIVTREDPLNLLSQQLSVLYEESFAGQPGDYVFQWKKAAPNADGTIPTDYANAYQARFPDTAGLTRFVIGGQGDTLANMVNTYYIMRYRAASTNAPAYAVMGDQWSDWCAPPALAEGWVQRVLNNVTPFTQRMQDLYENEAEDAVSMIRQAGGPYEGDVALNQDNLLNVGLIELYQTILNKAETMSLLQRTNDGGANKQLLLAVQRLADLYTVLGDEAYTDAMNPTIGIGASYGMLEGGLGLGYDYGAIASGLFCFDNQLPSLLEEELALLRGRSGANAPGTTIGPCYNRLVWNFTRGITAGEVAYAVNYNISGEKTPTIDYPQAAAAFPQGHGDAYGHYLSALAGYYRLLRNPYFSWGAPAMGEMVVADSVVNVDYYDESTFAKAAANVARTAVDVVDRTARKAWKESAGGVGAGYLDSDASRAFGYGEWASRGGYGALCSWVVANSLLPEAGGVTNLYSMQFTGGSTLTGTLPDTATTTNPAASWTLEFRLQTDEQFDADAVLLGWRGEARHEMLGVRLLSGGILSAGVYTNAEEVVEVDGAWETNYVNVAVWAFDTAPATLAPGRPYLAALSHRGGTETVDLRVFDANGVKIASRTLAIGAMPDLTGGHVAAGWHYEGALANFRLWQDERSDEALVAGWNAVSPATQGLVSSMPMTASSTDAAALIDEASGLAWQPDDVFWRVVETSAAQRTLNDQGLLRIDRGSVTELSELAECVHQIQVKTDAMDAGLNPLGLAEGAIPFDLSPLGENEAGATHFEQIRDRARVALKNAATILDVAQEHGSRLRQIEDARTGYANRLDTLEATYKNDLVALFGYPYAGDIGPSGTYPQGYDGPDLIHYMWMDLAPYGLTDVEDSKPVATLTYRLNDFGERLLFSNFADRTGTNVFPLVFSASGLVLKPADVAGARRAPGEIQQAYGNYLQTYAKLKRALYLNEERTRDLEIKMGTALVMRGAAQAKFLIRESIGVARGVIGLKRHILKQSLNAANYGLGMTEMIGAEVGESIPTISGAGLTVNIDPRAIVQAAMAPADVTTHSAFLASKLLIENALVDDYSQGLTQMMLEMLGAVASYMGEVNAIYQTVFDAFYAQIEARDELESAWGELLGAQAAFETVVAKAQRLLESRELERQQAAVALTKLRYHDMFFRQVRNESLARYSAAFDLAQKYVYLAAKAYDYETGLLASDPEAGDAFLRDVVGARALGTFDDDGNPVAGGSVGDPGLADIMARMDANWLVLKGRLGINNPQPYATWFSLRQELFRILPGAEGDGAWKTELAKYRVDDLLTLPEYRRYCQPFQAIGGLQAKEPGLVIPFGSTIDFARNFFGNDLAGEDSALDSTYFATKIAAAGIYFDGYNQKLNGYAGAAPFALTPAVYLIPIGDDRMRAPGLADGTVLSYRIVDQVVPLPYTVGSTHLDDPDWTPLFDGYTGGVDLAARIRKYPSFRAYFGSGGPSSAQLDCPRLVGRSAWNTRWLLIIPAGTLNANRDDALQTFINGKDANRDGIADLSGVTDIRLGLKTYSHSGN
ncbi:MAG: hypothetical protein ACOX9C_06795 [Kiritimatiellia bacterium]|jgi:hypothetical protein